MSDIDSLSADLEQKLAAADEAQRESEAAGVRALEAAQAAQAAREAFEAAQAAQLPPQTPAAEVPDSGAAPEGA